MTLYHIASELEENALKDKYFIDRKLFPNVDFYSGVIYRAMGIPSDMYTVMFVLGRFRLIAQWREMRLMKEPIGRPRQLFMDQLQEILSQKIIIYILHNA